MKHFLFVLAVFAVFVSPLAGQTANGECRATLAGVAQAEDHLDVTATEALFGGCDVGANAWSEVGIFFCPTGACSGDGNRCIGSPTCTVTTRLDTRCLADGTYPIVASGSCNGGGTIICNITRTADSRDLTFHRNVSLGGLSQQENPAGSHQFDISASYSINNASGSDRYIRIFNAKTNAFLGSCNGADIENPTGTCLAARVDGTCGIELRGEATACGTNAKDSATLTIPPSSACNVQLRGCPGGCNNASKKCPGGAAACSSATNDCKKCTSTSAGDPINVGGGDVGLNTALFTIMEPTGPLALTLYYDSERPLYASLSGEMGYGWSHTFAQSVRPIDPAADFLYYVDPTGLEQIFQRNGTLWTVMAPGSSRNTVSVVASEYRLTEQDGTIIAFDTATGHWNSTTDRWGNTTTAAYDTNGNLTSVTDPLGRVITIVATGTKLLQVTLPGGATWAFGYTNGNLSSIHDALHPTSGPAWRTMEYATGRAGEPRLLTALKDDADVALETHTYDSLDRGITSARANGRNQVTVQYDYPSAGWRRVTHQIDGTTTQVSDINVIVSDAHWVSTAVTGGCATCGASPGETRTFNSLGQVTRETNAASVATAFTYDSNNNVLTTTEADGTTSARTTTYEYQMSTWPTFRTTETLPAPYGTRVTTDTYSADERTLTQTVTGRTTSGATPVTFTSTTTFDGRHRILTTDGPRTDVIDVTSRVYYPDADPNVNRRGRLQSVTNAAGLTTAYDDYDIYGTARQITDSNGVVTTIETDARGRATAVVSQPVTGDPNETATYRSTTTYDTRDRVTQTTTARGTVTGYLYEDGTNRLMDTLRSDDGNQVERLHLTLNLVGWKTQEEAQVCATPAPVCSSWTTKRSESFTYTDQGKLHEVIHADGTKQTYTYDTAYRLSGVQDENHASANTTYGYDTFSRLQTVRQTLAGASGGAITTSYGYSVQDQLTSVTDPNGNVTTHEYDDFGRLTRQTSLVTGTTTYSYDATGNLTGTTDANGATTTRAYDASDRVTTATSTRTGSPTENVTWSYDAAAGYSRGRLTSVSDPSGSTTYEYDRRGLMRRETKVIEGNTYVTAYGHDANGNRTSITYPSGRVVAYTMDFADRPSSASAGASSIVTGATYLPFGPLTQLIYGNGTILTRSYDTRYRLLNNKLTQGATTIAEYGYSYDSAGNITGIADATDAAFNRTFSYDDINRLIAANAGNGLWSTGSYIYDAMGNMRSLQLGDARLASFTYAGTTPKMTSVTENGASSSVTYDAAGNETAVGSRASSYTARNQVGAAGGFTYTYDARGVRVISAAPAAAALSSLTLDPSSVGGGDPVTGTVTLAGPAPTGGVSVALTTDDHRLAQSPPSVFISGGVTTATFTLATFRPAASSASTTVRAFLQGTTRSTTVTVLRLPRVTGLTIAPPSVAGGNGATGTVALDISVGGDTTIALSSSNASAATVPATVVVTAGSTSATFPITTSAVSVDVTLTVTAAYRGNATASLTVTAPAVTLTTVSVAPANVVGGVTNPVGTVALSVPANAGGAIVTLSSSNSGAASVPGSVTVAAGNTTATFAVTTSSVGALTPVTITAIYGTTQTASINVGTCSTWTADAALVGNETLWFDDALPAGSTAMGTWQWQTSQKVTGSVSHDDPAAAGFHQHYFYGATQPVTLNTSMDEIVGYVLIDPCNPPREVMMHWNDGSSWEHRAFWGADLIAAGTSGTTSRQPMGALPPAGQWVRLAVPAYKVGLRGMTVRGMGFGLYDGHAWFDRIGTTACTTPVAPPSTNLPPTDTIWFDDATPAGATLNGTWVWDPAQKTSGTQSNTQPRADGWYQHWFSGGTPTLPVSVGEKLVAYALIDPCEPPDEIMIGWYDGSGWEHRAYWGANKINAGTDGTNSRRRMGDLPGSGQWVRLEVPASQVGLEGVTVRGIVFAMWSGHVWWDRIGKAPAGMGSLRSPEPMISSNAGGSVPSLLRRMATRWRGPSSSASFGVAANLIARPNTAGVTRTYSFYTPELQLLSETALTEATTPPIAHDYVWFGGEPLAQIDASTGEIAYDFNDHLGAPILQISQTGAIVWRAEREPYGDRYLIRTGADRQQPLGLPGQQYSENAPDVQYNIFRWYRSSWGRYSQADPVGLREGPNLYLYAAARPTYFIDPYGLAKCQACDECPSGVWRFDGPALSVSGGVIAGGSVTWGTLCCRDAKMPMNRETACMKVRIDCTWGGLIAAIGIGVSGPLGPLPNACGCKSKDLLGESEGWTSAAGPFSLDIGDCKDVPGRAHSFTPAISKSWGAGFARTRCTTKRDD